MLLEYTDKTSGVTDEELLSDLQDTSKEIGKKSLTIAEYKEYGHYSPTTVTNHFGTWNNALNMAGLQISKQLYSDQDLFDNLAELWIKIGHQPSRYDLSRFQSPISSATYERRFGKWSAALKSFVDYYNSQEGPEFCKIEEKPTTNHKTTRNINLRMRFKVMSRDNFKCCVCGASPAKDPSVELHIDHIIPWAKGGETVFENLQTLCSKCNYGKSDLLYI